MASRGGCYLPHLPELNANWADSGECSVFRFRDFETRWLGLGLGLAPLLSAGLAADPPLPGVAAAACWGECFVAAACLLLERGRNGLPREIGRAESEFER